MTIDPEKGDPPKPASYLIVGAGVFGLSTAYHLACTRPDASILVLDRHDVPNPASASWDLNKIIRADYRDPFYMKLAREACAAWDSDPLFAPHFHQSGMIFAEDAGKSAAMLRNAAALDPDCCLHSGSSSDNDDSDDCRSRESPAFATPPPAAAAPRLLSVAEARATYASLADMNLQGVQRVYVNPLSGWAEALPALQSVAREAVARGVVIRRADVTKLLLDGRDLRAAGRVAAGGLRCKGVRTNDGVDVLAERVLVCAGAYTAKLLADSWPGEPMLQAGDRLVAAAALSCTLRVLDPEKRVMHRNGPVVANELPHTAAESIPLNKDGVVKFNLDASFTNNQLHVASGKIISWPPQSADEGQWTTNVPKALQREAQQVAANLYGCDLTGFELESYRICWDSCTKDQEWIISPLGGCENIFIAAGGSFHAWKFLPNLGKYIVEMMNGKLDAEKANRWAWDRPVCSKDGACDTYAPKRDLNDLSMAE